ncbi:unnamed protein product [Clonostachys byssicola]|uniref:Uncharacterized protein n=1 Tax=Clonostachys byssicola TaxID=160290 RepID=A0A9N9UBK1_9HYPO|nr:unnamed protein product [Clonostachys byssicola]
MANPASETCRSSSVFGEGVELEPFLRLFAAGSLSTSASTLSVTTSEGSTEGQSSSKGTLNRRKLKSGRATQACLECRSRKFISVFNKRI